MYSNSIPRAYFDCFYANPGMHQNLASINLLNWIINTFAHLLEISPLPSRRDTVMDSNIQSLFISQQMRHHIKINGTPTNRYRSCHNYKLRPPFPSFLIHLSKKKRKNMTRLSFFSRITVLPSDFPSTATPSQHRSVHSSTLSNFFLFPFQKYKCTRRISRIGARKNFRFSLQFKWKPQRGTLPLHLRHVDPMGVSHMQLRAQLL